jgi:hypothetical protein
MLGEPGSLVGTTFVTELSRLVRQEPAMTTSAPAGVSLATGMDMLRFSGNGQCYGRFMLKPGPGSRPSLQARLVAVSLADQVARAFSAGEAARSAR